MSAPVPLPSLFQAIDNKDVDGFLEHLSESASFRFGSAPAAVGQGAIREAVSGFFDSIAGLKHELSRTIVDGDVLVCEGTVTYERFDERQVSLPFVNVFEMSAGTIDDYRIYIDIGPLYA